MLYNTAAASPLSPDRFAAPVVLDHVRSSHNILDERGASTSAPSATGTPPGPNAEFVRQRLNNRVAASRLVVQTDPEYSSHIARNAYEGFETTVMGQYVEPVSAYIVQPYTD
ncbi:unnamed protein product [Amoebophrya sp. A25]|nr:unnamed protein product [Amoebophrya sp. A25]|eukprot:GSA25T00011098001.1